MESRDKRSREAGEEAEEVEAEETVAATGIKADKAVGEASEADAVFCRVLRGLTAVDKAGTSPA